MRFSSLILVILTLTLSLTSLARNTKLISPTSSPQALSLPTDHSHAPVDVSPGSAFWRPAPAGAKRISYRRRVLSQDNDDESVEGGIDRNYSLIHREPLPDAPITNALRQHLVKKSKPAPPGAATKEEEDDYKKHGKTAPVSTSHKSTLQADTDCSLPSLKQIPGAPRVSTKIGLPQALAARAAKEAATKAKLEARNPNRELGSPDREPAPQPEPLVAL